MITTSNGEKIETYVALRRITAALDRRFPDGNTIFQRVSRLCEEAGELAAAVNHAECMGIKKEKYGKPTDKHLLKELEDVMRAVLGIAIHYQLEDKLEESIQASYRSYEEREKTSS